MIVHLSEWRARRLLSGFVLVKRGTDVWRAVCFAFPSQSLLMILRRGGGGCCCWCAEYRPTTGHQSFCPEHKRVRVWQPSSKKIRSRNASLNCDTNNKCTLLIHLLLCIHLLKLGSSTRTNLHLSRYFICSPVSSSTPQCTSLLSFVLYSWRL